jgi:hypothetical protein
MAFIGNTNLTQSFTPAVDFFSGNASTVAFTLSRPVASVAQVQAVIENVPQAPGDAYTVSGNTITFTSAPPSGTNNIYVYYTSPITTVIQPGQGTVGTAQLASGVLTPTAVSDQLNSSTGYFDLPAGTTAQRPGSSVNGMARYNSTTSQFEVYQNGSWTSYASVYTVEYLVIAGGGAGGGNGGGGGGGGGYRSSVSGESSGGGASAESPTSVTTGGSYTVTIGAGGAVLSTGSNFSAAGSNSAFGSITSAGGGGAGHGGVPAYRGGPGGSGGGGAAYNVYESGGISAGGAGTTGQGYAGGTGNSGGNNWFASAGGGGAGAVGVNSSTNAGTLGGVGVASSITGTSVTRGGGGSGYLQASAAAGGGGANTVNGTANTGGGGGAGAFGGSGVVIIRYLGAQRGTGGTVTSSGGYTIHTFTTSGTYSA